MIRINNKIYKKDSPEAIEYLANKEQTKLDALTYKDKRKEILPSIGDQLDMIYWDQVNGTTLWKEMITSIKLNHPKGE